MRHGQDGRNLRFLYACGVWARGVREGSGDGRGLPGFSDRIAVCQNSASTTPIAAQARVA